VGVYPFSHHLAADLHHVIQATPGRQKRPDQVTGIPFCDGTHVEHRRRMVLDDPAPFQPDLPESGELQQTVDQGLADLLAVPETETPGIDQRGHRDVKGPPRPF